MNNYSRISFLVFLFLSVITGILSADTVSLKNGREIVGLIVKEDEKSIELNVGSGVVTFEKSNILHIRKTDLEESTSIRQKWQDNKLKAEAVKSEQERQPKKVNVEHEKGHIFLDVLLNGKVKVNLLLDTGATFVVLSSNIAEKLGVNLAREKRDLLLQVADGRSVNAKLIVLKSLKVEGVEAKNVEAAVMPYSSDAGDGVIGMSFLRRFNFKVDYSRNKLILEKIK